tara:strand:- start:13189 stop:13848 length:660 start_codon:yes stop_codon:yes gene_type:complete
MCFSAEVSFGAGAVITTVGVIAFKKADTTAQKFFACIPFFFAIQQFTEGALWLTLTDAPDSDLTSWFSHLFLFFAWVIWPTYVPFTMRLLETNPKRRTVITVFLVMGILVSLLHIHHLIFYHIHAQVDGPHIKYLMDYSPQYPWLIGVFYFIVIVISLFVSTAKRMIYLAVMVLATFIVTISFFQDHQISVWCFFAAVTSLMVLWVLVGIKNDAKVKRN